MGDETTDHIVPWREVGKGELALVDGELVIVEDVKVANDVTLYLRIADRAEQTWRHPDALTAVRRKAAG